MNAEFIDTKDGRWLAFLQNCPHDFYHLPEYVEFAARHADGEAVAFIGEVGDSTLFVPLTLCPVPHGATASALSRDASSPYGYASPLLQGAGSKNSEQRLWQLFSDSCHDHGIVSVFMRSNPLLHTPLQITADATVVREGETVFIDLGKSEEELRQQTRANHRKNIRKLKEAGYHVLENDWSYLDGFVELYHATMQRVGADSYYHFSRTYFHELATLIPGKVHLFSVLSGDGELAAAGLFFAHSGIVQFHLSGTAEEYIRFAPNKLLFDFVRHWAKQRGERYFHLGGGVGCAADSLFKFKSGFSHDRALFHTIRMVCDPVRYEEFTTEAIGSVNLKLTQKDYFPIYRIDSHLGQDSRSAQ